MNWVIEFKYMHCDVFLDSNKNTSEFSEWCINRATNTTACTFEVRFPFKAWLQLWAGGCCSKKKINTCETEARICAFHPVGIRA